MIRELHQVIRLIEGDWRNTRVFVVGDVMLDRYIWGDVERISPEAPVPIVHAMHRNERPGGAANVAMNIAGLGAKATLFGFVGDDENGAILEACVREAAVIPELTRVASYPTTTKLRILSGRQQMLRLDTEQVAGYPPESYAALLARLDATLESADAVVLSDYAKGSLTE
jgi:D-beta-D-heptose 7-phosphate kinase/D-beta-D-heptose 1-phosphate adenosyltransferase